MSPCRTACRINAGAATARVGTLVWAGVRVTATGVGVLEAAFASMGREVTFPKNARVFARSVWDSGEIVSGMGVCVGGDCRSVSGGVSEVPQETSHTTPNMKTAIAPRALHLFFTVQSLPWKGESRQLSLAILSVRAAVGIARLHSQ